MKNARTAHFLERSVSISALRERQPLLRGLGQSPAHFTKNLLFPFLAFSIIGVT